MEQPVATNIQKPAVNQSCDCIHHGDEIRNTATTVSILIRAPVWVSVWESPRFAGIADSPKNIAARSAKPKVLFMSDVFSGQQSCGGCVLHALGDSTVRGSRLDMTDWWREIESRIAFEKTNRLEH